MSANDQAIEHLWQEFCAGKRRALSQLLSALSASEELEQVRQLVAEKRAETGASRCVAITGSGGVGKSTFVGRLVEYLRGEHLTVAVLACDPQSAITGGALLGDRVRMPSYPDDDGIFVRSLAVPSGQQAIAREVPLMVDLLACFGFQVVLVETVGAGQGDIAVKDIADQLVLLVQPEAGDDMQWEKAGLLEVADIVVVNKGDLPGAARVESQLRELLNLPGCREVPVVRVSASQGQGIDTLWAKLTSERT